MIPGSCLLCHREEFHWKKSLQILPATNEQGTVKWRFIQHQHDKLVLKRDTNLYYLVCIKIDIFISICGHQGGWIQRICFCCHHWWFGHSQHQRPHHNDSYTWKKTANESNNIFGNKYSIISSQCSTFPHNKVTIQLFPLCIATKGITHHTQFPFKSLPIKKHLHGLLLSFHCDDNFCFFNTLGYLSDATLEASRSGFGFAQFPICYFVLEFCNCAYSIFALSRSRNAVSSDIVALVKFVSIPICLHTWTAVCTCSKNW